MARYPRQQLYIDGTYVEASGGQVFESINPANGEVLAIRAEFKAAYWGSKAAKIFNFPALLQIEKVNAAVERGGGEDRFFWMKSERHDCLRVLGVTLL